MHYLSILNPSYLILLYEKACGYVCIICGSLTPQSAKLIWNFKNDKKIIVVTTSLLRFFRYLLIIRLQFCTNNIGRYLKLFVDY